MRRSACVAAAAVLVALIGANAKAQVPAERAIIHMPSLARGAFTYRDVPTAVLTRTPTVTATPIATGTTDVVGTIVAATLTAGAPTPSDTPDRVQTSVAGTMTALVPTVTQTPTLTRTPTPTRTTTPTVGPSPTATLDARCSEKIINGGAEDTTGWRAINGTRWRAQANVGMTPFEGLWVLEVSPPAGAGLIVQSNAVTLPSLDDLASVTLSYQLQGHTVERLPNTDGFLASFDRAPGTGATDPQQIEVQFNNSIDREWRGRSFELLPQIRAVGWQKIVIDYFVSNDVSDNSWWYIDVVSLIVCTK